MEYLTLDDALFIHAEQLRLFGGAPKGVSQGVRDLGLIESALLRPQTGYYADLVEQAAALWESLAMNQWDGNKRVAFACMDIFLGLNGARLEAEPGDVIAFIYSHLEAGTFRKPVLEEWLRAHVSPSPLAGKGGRSGAERSAGEIDAERWTKLPLTYEFSARSFRLTPS